jgi:hypothetical protein
MEIRAFIIVHCRYSNPSVVFARGVRLNPWRRARSGESCYAADAPAANRRGTDVPWNERFRRVTQPLPGSHSESGFTPRQVPEPTNSEVPGTPKLQSNSPWRRT